MASSARIDELQKKFDENPKRYFAPLANEFRKAGDLEQAIALCRAFLPQQPGHMSGHIVFGQALFESKLHDEARTVFETALALDPENLIALRHLGDIARETGDIAAASGWYRRVLDADPRNEEIAELLATLPVLSSAPEAASPEAASPEAASPGDAAAQWSEPAPADPSAVSAAAAPAAPAPASAPPSRASGGVRHEEDAGPLSMRESLEVPAIAAPAPSDGIERSTEVDIGALAAEPAPSSSPAFTSSGPANDMGFEVMEFVPPERAESASRPSGFVEDAPGADAGTPAAFVTETMAELYLQQGFYQEALTVYRQLLAQNPNDVGLRERVEQLASGARSSVGVAAVSDAVIESAQRRRAGPAVRTIRAFLASLAGRRVVLRADADAPEGVEEQGAPQRWSAPVADAREGRERDERGADESSGRAYAESVPAPRGDAYEPRAPSYDDGAGDEPSGADLPWLTTDEAEEPAASVERTERPAGDAPRADVGGGWGAPESLSPSAGREETPAAETRPARLSGEMGSVNTLFSGAPVTSDDAAAAELLAGAFLVPEGSPPAAPNAGRPARAAANELSLDNVFREPGHRTSTEQRRSAFSFDQFFSEGGSGDAGGAADSEAEHSPDDIAQFNAWLEGLKKK